MSFIFGGDTGITYEQLQQRRKMVERLRQANSARSPRNVGEGIHAVARALVARGVDKQNAERAEEMRKEYGQLWSGLSPYLSGGAGTPGASYSGEGTFTAAPQPDEDRMGLDMGSTEAGFDAAKNPTETRGGKTYDMGRDVEPDKVALIKETAAELGMDPVDLATIISYETAGTFDPTKAGPTTKWGQHRGLIQFGEPQAKRYGVDWENPLTSQLGRDGAIVRYFRDSGWQPGMSFMDAYSTVNAGAPGRYNASDTAAGGAPGTVADKVNNQMGAHRQKAAALLGGTWTPAASQSGGGVRTAQAGGFDPSIVQLAQMLSVPDEFMPPGQKAVAQALLGQKLTQAQNANDPLRQLQIQKMQMDLQRGMQAPPRDTQYVDGVGLIDKNTGDVIRQYDSKPKDQPSSVREYQFYQQQEIDAGREPLSYADWSVLDEKAGNPAMVQAQQDARETAADVVVSSALRAISAADSRAVGGILGQVAAINPGSPNAEVYRQVSALKSIASAEALNAMRRQSPTGGALGNVTERELDLLSQQAGVLDPKSPNFKRDMQDYVQTMLRTIHGREKGDAIFSESLSEAFGPSDRPESADFPDVSSMKADEIAKLMKERPSSTWSEEQRQAVMRRLRELQGSE